MPLEHRTETLCKAVTEVTSHCNLGHVSPFQRKNFAGSVSTRILGKRYALIPICFFGDIGHKEPRRKPDHARKRLGLFQGKQSGAGGKNSIILH